MAIGANARRWPLAREELLPVAIDAGLVFRKLSYILKRRVTLSDRVPVLGRKFVAGTALELLVGDVSGVGKLRVVNAWPLRPSTSLLGASSLGYGFNFNSATGHKARAEHVRHY